MNTLTRAARRPAVATERVVVQDGFTLAADVAGPPDGPRVLLTHGGGQSRRAWDGGLRTLANAGYRVWSLDMRGHGESDWAPDGLYALEHWAGDLKRIVARMATDGGGPIALVGASRGGQSSLLTASDLPDLVSCVVLVDVTPQTNDGGIALVRSFLERSAQGFESLDEAASVLAELMGRPARADNSGLARHMRTDPSGRLFWHWDPRMAAPAFVRPPTEQPLMEDAASRVRTPVLLIRAGLSELVREQDVEHFRSLTPGLEVVEIPGIGHMMTGDSNDVFMPPILSFLRRHDPVSQP